MWSRPSDSACAFTAWLPGTIITRLALTRRPSSTAATARMSSIRPFVHEPMNTVSTGMSRSAVPAVRPMYSRARATVSRVVGSAKSSGDGTVPSIDATWPGFVPHVTCGRRVVASMCTSRSQTAPSSVRSSRHDATASSQAAPVGAWARPRRYSNVVSSGATSPALAPASIDMLQIVMRPSIERPRIVEPRYSITWPMPPPVPISPITARMTSFAVTPAGSSPSTLTAIHFGRLWGSVCVASTCSTSLVPMPNARAPKAPCVAVWLSPQTIVMPGSVRPCSGPMMCTMPWPGSPIGKLVMPNSAVFSRSTCDLAGGDRVGDRLVDVGRRDVVVLGRDRQLGAPHRAPRQPQPVERLRAGDLVDEVQVDVEEVRLAWRRAHEVAIPHLLRECLW